LKKYICTICNYIYDESKGHPEAGIAPGTKWEDLPEDFVCPICGASQDAFDAYGSEETKAKADQPVNHVPADMKELSALEVSTLCHNLAKACEKMYAFDEEAKFKELAEYFKAGASPVENPSYSSLQELVDEDINSLYPYAEQVAKEEGDRGALRSITWTIKTTRMLKSILSRYEKEGDKMLENTGVYVCSICGYIYIGDDLPRICPICKVPNWKFDKVEGGAL
jgi:rubredoxin